MQPLCDLFLAYTSHVHHGFHVSLCSFSSAHSPGGGFVAAVAVVFIALGTEKRRHENKMQRVTITGNSTNLFSSQTAGGGLFEAAEAVGDKGEEGEQKRGVLEVDASIQGRWEEDDDDDDDDEAMQHYCLSRARSLFTQADGYRSKMQFQKPQTQPPVLDPTNSLLSGLLLLHQGPTCAPELHRKRRFCMYFKAQREREKGREGSEHWVMVQGFDRRCARSGTRVFLCPFESCREFSNNPCLQQFVQRSLKPFRYGCWRILREECSRRRSKRICRCKGIFLAVSERELERKQEWCPWEEEEQVH
jgi:hypothetical protein